MVDFKQSGKRSFGDRDSSSKFGKRSSGGSSRGFGRRDSESSGRRDSRSDDRYSDSGPRRLSSRPDHEMHEVTCSKCGKQCEVPFKPTSDRPVYCSDCFKKNDDRPQDRRFSDSKPGISPKDLEKINEKLDKILQALNVDQD